MKIRSAGAIVTLLALLNLFNYFDRTILAAIGPKLSESLGLTDTQYGFVGNAFMMGYLVMSPIFGALAGRRGRVGLMALGVMAWSLATGASGLMTSFTTMMAARFAVGIGEASYGTLAPTIVDDLAAPGKKNRVFALFYVAIPVGSALGFVVGGALEHSFGWRAAFFLAGGPGLLFALLLLFVVEPARTVREEATVSGVRAYRELFRLPLYRNAVLGYTAQTFALGGFALWAPKYLYQRLGMELAAADRWFGTVLVVAGLAATFLGGQLGDRWPGSDRPRAYLRLCAWTSIVGFPFAALCLWAGSPTVFFLAIGVAEFAIFTSTSPINVVVLSSVPSEMRGIAMAASIATIHVLGDLISPPLIGFLSDRSSLQNAMFILPLAILASAGFWWRGSAPVGALEIASRPSRA